jgi:hypothetical protein
VVWIVPFGNSKPPVVDCTIPATVRVEEGAEVPIPTLPEELMTMRDDGLYVFPTVSPASVKK